MLEQIKSGSLTVKTFNDYHKINSYFSEYLDNKPQSDNKANYFPINEVSAAYEEDASIFEQSVFLSSLLLKRFAFFKNTLTRELVIKIQEMVRDAVNSGNFYGKFGLSNQMAQSAIKITSFNNASKLISSGVGKQVRELKSIQLTINQLDGPKQFLLRQGVRSKDNAPAWIVEPAKYLSEGGGVSTQLLPRETLNSLKLNDRTIQWPFEAFGHQSDPGEGIDPALDVIRNFDGISEEDDITTYKFEFFNDIAPESLDSGGAFAGIISSIGDWFQEDPDRTTEGIILRKLSGQYLDFFSEVIRQTTGESGSFDLSVDNLTIGQISDKYFKNDNFIREIYFFIAADKEIARRVEIIRKLEKLEADRGENVTPLTDEEIADARLAGAEAWNTTQVEAAKADALSEDAIKNMQKLFKQCALMINMDKLRDDYSERIKQIYSGSLPYNGRFYVAKCGGDGKVSNQETLLTKLVSSEKEQSFFELEPWQISSLTPKLRLFKVMEDGAGKTKEVEFVFERTSKIDRPDKVMGADYTSEPTKFMSAKVDKGSGVGLKEFSVDFSGTNPAEARNDIKATLKLFFQSFTDFIRYRNSESGKQEDVYRYVDLVIQPVSEASNKAYGIDVSNKRQYEPSFYRIRADLGYYVPSFADKKLRDAIEQSNKSFVLTMVDHDISFNKDGSVEINIEYRAYLESLLKHPKLDALASPELIKKREESSKRLAEQLNKRDCSVEQIRELQISLQAEEEAIAQKSLRSIMERMERRGVIYNTQIKEKDRTFFLNNGFFRECGLEATTESINTSTTDLGKVLAVDLPEKSESFDFLDSKDTLVQYFYFGDLLYTILDCVFDENDKPRDGLGNNKIILGSFEYDTFVSNQLSNNKIYGIDQMPISVDFFSRWFIDNVITQKDSRKSFPVLNFIRQLSNSLIKQSLIENCVNRKVEKKLRFQTGQVTAYSKSGDPMVKIASDSFKNNEPIINVDTYRTNGALPFTGGLSEKSESGNFYNYIVLSAIGSTLTYTGTGDYAEDIKQGRFHVQIGQKSGIVKSINLSKTSQTYLKEARFFQNGVDGLLQLSNVYVAKLEMFGNTIFYPGMEFFFNPYGLGGGTEFGRPQDKGAVAWKMGIGGYHTVTSVKTTLTPNSFSTTISGQQYYSGDGTGNSDLHARRKGDAITVSSYTPDWGENDVDKKDKMDACNAIISQIQFPNISDNSSEGLNQPITEPIPEIPTPESTPPVKSEPIEEQQVSKNDVGNFSSKSNTTLAISGKSYYGTLYGYEDGSLKFLYADENGVEHFVNYP